MKLRRLFKKRKGKNPFEASMPIDKDEVKIVEARYNGKPLLFGVGIAEKREINVAGKGGSEGIGAEYQKQKDFKWDIAINPAALPDGFMHMDKFKEWAASTVSVVSGSPRAASKETQFIETHPKLFDDLYRKATAILSNADLESLQKDLIAQQQMRVKQFILDGLVEIKNGEAKPTNKCPMQAKIDKKKREEPTRNEDASEAPS